MTYQEIILRVAKDMKLSPEVVEEAYRSFFNFIRNKIEALPLKEDLSQEQFNELKTNFNIPSLGKLNCTYDKYSNMKERYKYLNKIIHNET